MMPRTSFGRRGFPRSESGLAIATTAPEFSVWQRSSWDVNFVEAVMTGLAQLIILVVKSTSSFVLLA
jgi:hypothetical protein